MAGEDTRYHPHSVVHFKFYNALARGDDVCSVTWLPPASWELLIGIRTHLFSRISSFNFSAHPAIYVLT